MNVTLIFGVILFVAFANGAPSPDIKGGVKHDIGITHDALLDGSN